jgi:thiol-disulfide isomerase/thioredoxin
MDVASNAIPNSWLYGFHEKAHLKAAFIKLALLFAAPLSTFEGKQVPRMVLTEFDGKRVELPLKGRITFVNFWSVTCGPCVAEIPQLNDLFIKYNSQVLFLAVSPDSKERIDSFL